MAQGPVGVDHNLLGRNRAGVLLLADRVGRHLDLGGRGGRGGELHASLDGCRAAGRLGLRQVSDRGGRLGAASGETAAYRRHKGEEGQRTRQEFMPHRCSFLLARHFKMRSTQFELARCRSVSPFPPSQTAIPTRTGAPPGVKPVPESEVNGRPTTTSHRPSEKLALPEALSATQASCSRDGASGLAGQLRSEPTWNFILREGRKKMAAASAGEVSLRLGSCQASRNAISIPLYSALAATEVTVAGKILASR